MSKKKNKIEENMNEKKKTFEMSNSSFDEKKEPNKNESEIENELSDDNKIKIINEKNINEKNADFKKAKSNIIYEIENDVRIDNETIVANNEKNKVIKEVKETKEVNESNIQIDDSKKIQVEVESEEKNNKDDDNNINKNINKNRVRISRKKKKDEIENIKKEAEAEKKKQKELEQEAKKEKLEKEKIEKEKQKQEAKEKAKEEKERRKKQKAEDKKKREEEKRLKKEATSKAILEFTKRSFNPNRLMQNLLILLLVFCLIIIAVKIHKELNDKDSFHSVSSKDYKNLSGKSDALNNAYQVIEENSSKNDTLSATNLNLSQVYEEVKDPEDVANKSLESSQPVPVTMEEEKIEGPKSTAFQIFEKLQKKYQMYVQSIYNLCDMNPVMIVRQYHYDGYSIIGKYNPEDPSHKKGKRHTYFIPNFTNVNIHYLDGDGNPISDDNNIKDIMSMASVYTYYHNPYDIKTFLNYSYELFDKSYSYVASVSEVYYCSGCMEYYDKNVATESDISYDISLNKISREHAEQHVKDKQIPYKSGTLYKMQEGTYHFKEDNYDKYVDDIYAGKQVTTNNYCPGHIDLNVYVTVMTLDASRGLPSIDSFYGNRGLNYTKNWHGWDKMMLNKARELSYKDWEKEYGISVSYVNKIKPLTQEEINYYMNRLDDNITVNRKKVVETALKSVGRIPYYYGGKTSRGGYEANYFGTKVPTDYKGRCLKGLDCSGWVNWVYMTAFNKYIIKSEGTAKLATEGTKITRKDLLPGDIIVRPGIDSHVMMFLEWAPDGKMKVIHENGSVNNVSIATFDAYYPYYRRIINT